MSTTAAMPVIQSTQSTHVVRQEVNRFLEAARKRSEDDGDHRRRTRRRHHRSWPLLISLTGKPFDPDISVALHNASELGIAFLASFSVPVGSRVFIKLFCYDDFCPRVPAVVRHVTETEHGFLVGCEFELNNESACLHALELGRHSRSYRATY